jgi:hypothetical protein
MRYRPSTVDPEHMLLLVRRQYDVDAIVATISDWTAALPGRPSTSRRVTGSRSAVVTCDEWKLLTGI